MPLAPERFGLQVTLDQESYDLLQQARALMSHQVPTGEIVPVLKCALKLLVAHLEKRKFAATSRPRDSRPATSARHIAAAVRRVVRERDGGQCTYISDSGKRCPARTLLEFDHEVPVARGGEATAENIRLRCRGHNQYAAECTFGTEFMSDKREAARHAATEAKARAAAGDVQSPRRRIGRNLVVRQPSSTG
jgi:5-methylcytosine-specific restriction endonuclease McrA